MAAAAGRLRQPMIVEFFGLPGAGKTSVARACAAEGVDFQNVVLSPGPWRKAPDVLRGFARPITRIRLATAVVRTRQDGLLRLAQKIYDLWYVSSFWDAGKGDRVMLDQGLVQAFWSVAVTARVDLDSRALVRLQGLLARLIQDKPRAEVLLVRLDVDQDLAVVRLQARRDHESILERQPDLWRRGSEALELAAALAAGSGRVLRLDGSAPEESLRLELKARICDERESA